MVWEADIQDIFFVGSVQIESMEMKPFSARLQHKINFIDICARKKDLLKYLQVCLKMKQPLIENTDFNLNHVFIPSVVLFFPPFLLFL